MVIALIPIGNSRRLKGKHFLKLGDKRIIDHIVEKLYLSNLFEKIVVYSVKEIEIKNAIILIDYEEKGALNVLIKTLNEFNSNVFLLAGDLPFFSIEHVKRMMVYPDQLSIIPKWSNGYLEPMHALYSISAKYYEEKASFHEFIEQIPKLFIPAESFPSYEFFNINTLKDYQQAKELYQSLVIHGYEI